ncbi:MAG: transcriptional repressor LexA [Myxococcales bacterium]|nr:transcriptional repressor LexA [Myxococcales bacterium]USN50676.1 MAG: repressor LexA [Myxococcales bacterium]
MARELTEKQKRVLSTLEAYWNTYQVPPSISDLAKELGINKATAYEHLLALKKKGYLVHQARAGRTWRLSEKVKQSLCNHLQIPVLGRVSAGLPILAHENIEEHITSELPATKELFALRVVGESMIKAHIKSNDIVIADKTASVKNNDIVVALIDGEEATVKRFEKIGSLIRLIPENNDFKILELDAERVHILGKVIEIRRSIA